MQRTTVVALQSLLAILIVLLFLCQLFIIPAVARQSAARYFQVAYLQVPGIILGILFILCVQIVLLCVWRLLSLVRNDSIFNETAFPAVDVSLRAVGFATVLVVIALVTLSLTGMATPSLLLLCVLGVVIGGGLTLLIVVMRSLLHRATQLEHDLSEVV